MDYSMQPGHLTPLAAFICCPWCRGGETYELDGPYHFVIPYFFKIPSCLFAKNVKAPLGTQLRPYPWGGTI